MSDNYDWDDDDFNDEEDAPQLRTGDDLVRKLRKSDRAKEKRIKELETALADFNKRERENIVKTVLSERGVNPKIAAFIPADIDFTTEAINNWVEEYADVFGLQTQQNAAEQQVNPNLAALRQIDAATSGAATPALAESLLSQIGSADSMEELMKIIYSE
jgi:N-methylhydantoinase A/oxoprolinase/acetone carboxylase beta subunit